MTQPTKEFMQEVEPKIQKALAKHDIHYPNVGFVEMGNILRELTMIAWEASQRKDQ